PAARLHSYRLAGPCRTVVLPDRRGGNRAGRMRGGSRRRPRPLRGADDRGRPDQRDAREPRPPPPCSAPRDHPALGRHVPRRTSAALPIHASLWIEGQTGSLKSTLAARFLSHFGSFERISLPGAWSSTANQLERRAFLLKDVLFVVDDYAPGGADTRD